MLENYRIIELGVWVAGPAAAGVLADWGAEVIKVESPEGDPMRRMLQVIVGHGEPQSPPFDLDNRGKRSVVLDLKEQSGRDTLHRMVAEADVFLTNLRVDALERLGFGPDQLLAANPRLVYALVTGYGTEGPDADRAGYDVGGFWARTGVAATFAPEGRPPPNIRGGFGDHATALAMLSGILGALLEREHTGRGQLVETSLLRTGIYCLGWDLGMQMRFGSLRPAASHRRDQPDGQLLRGGRRQVVLAARCREPAPLAERVPRHRPRGSRRGRALRRRPRPPPQRGSVHRRARRAFAQDTRDEWIARASTSTACGGRRSSRPRRS